MDNHNEERSKLPPSYKNRESDRYSDRDSDRYRDRDSDRYRDRGAKMDMGMNMNSSSLNKRQLFANRMRTASAGSTRGAFGPLPVDASAHNPEDIYEQQQSTINARRHFIGNTARDANTNGNTTYTTSGHHVHTSSERTNSRTGTYQNNTTQMPTHSSNMNTFSNKKKAFHSPGESIDATNNMNNIFDTHTLANIVRESQYEYPQEYQQDLEQGQGQAHTSTTMGMNHHQHHPLQSSSYANINYHNYQDEGAPLNSNTYNAVPYPNLPLPPYGSVRQGQNNNQMYNHQTSQVTHDFTGAEDMYAAAAAKQQYHENIAKGYKSNASLNSRNHSNSSDFSEYDDDYIDLEPKTWYQYLVFHKECPEFTTMQQNTWATLLGVFMGIFTFAWGRLIESSVEFTWKTVPEYLLEKGIFTDLNGRFPLPYYMIICPAIYGGILSYITAKIENPKVPGQNEWIDSLHRTGVMDHTMFFHIILLSTAGMASGLSLGPEMPLVLTAGMVGSLVGLNFNQTILSSRVMNLTAASAAIAGFFGFPMAGALFVLELPHRMGLQYFEALTPATLASIISVVVNRMISGGEVKGMFKYPFLNESLPSYIVWVVIVFGIVGSLVGVLYAEGLLFLKHWVHDWFHAPHHHHHHHHHHQGYEYSKIDGHFKKEKGNCCTWLQRGLQRFFGISHEPTRAAVAGTLVGVIVGFICMLLPHNLFWGEAQLQTMIDRGMTPLPVFGHDDEPTAILTAYGYCLIDPDDQRAEILGMSTSCVGMIAFTKIIVVGLSLGTGVCGGHFWAPLFVGCAASHFFTDVMGFVTNYIGFGKELASYPCLAVLCIMGSTHIVTFRAQMAIILVLTLSIRSFTTQEKLFSVNGDYAAIFPLLVIASYLPLSFTRSVIFYAKQTCRGDITVIPEALMEPLKEGTTHHNNVYRMENLDDLSSNDSSYTSNDEEDERDLSVGDSDDESHDGISIEPFPNGNTKEVDTTAEDVSVNSPQVPDGSRTAATSSRQSVVDSKSRKNNVDPLGVSTHSSLSQRSARSRNVDPLGVSTHSIRSQRSRKSSSGSLKKPQTVQRVSSYGKIEGNYQKPLLAQGRERASTAIAAKSASLRSIGDGPKLPRHRRSRSSTTASSENMSPAKYLGGDATSDLDVSKH